MVNPSNNETPRARASASTRAQCNDARVSGVVSPPARSLNCSSNGASPNSGQGCTSANPPSTRINAPRRAFESVAMNVNRHQRRQPATKRIPKLHCRAPAIPRQRFNSAPRLRYTRRIKAIAKGNATSGSKVMTPTATQRHKRKGRNLGPPKALAESHGQRLLRALLIALHIAQVIDHDQHRRQTSRGETGQQCDPASTAAYAGNTSRRRQSNPKNRMTNNSPSP